MILGSARMPPARVGLGAAQSAGLVTTSSAQRRLPVALILDQRQRLRLADRHKSAGNLHKTDANIWFMKVAVPTLSPIFRSDVQGQLLAAILVDPDRESSITSLSERVGTSFQTAMREIDRAADAGIVSVRRVGNTRLVRANQTHPLYPAYRQIVLATYGPPAVIRQELEGIPGIERVLIFGSWAARYEGEPGTSPHDIDVLVVGSPLRNAVYDAAERAERRIGLPVQLTIRSQKQWGDPGKDSFLNEIKARPIVAVIGDVG
jgi:predicted transcriptional regulator/predicted nucleotidyltransferase